jgi:hypothetical protein
MTTLLKAFLGDREREFRLTFKLIDELQRLTGKGFGKLCMSLFAGDYSFRDAIETIRLALIGGGAAPEEAATLIKVYIEGEPLAPTYALAVSILEATYFGVDASKQLVDAPAKNETAQ